MSLLRSPVIKQHKTQTQSYFSAKKAIIHQVTTMLATSENVLFPGHNHLLTTSTDDLTPAGAWEIIKVLGYQYHWLAGGYVLAFLHSVHKSE